MAEKECWEEFLNEEVHKVVCAPDLFIEHALLGGLEEFLRKCAVAYYSKYPYLLKYWYR
jgi:hypothetical protein